MRLLIDPELRLPCAWAQRPEVLVGRHGATRTRFGYLSAGTVVRITALLDGGPLVEASSGTDFTLLKPTGAGCKTPQ